METLQPLLQGYSTCMVNANEDGYTSHDTGPFSLEFVRLAKMTVNAGIEQANNSCNRIRQMVDAYFHEVVVYKYMTKPKGTRNLFC